jgi:hypothetical protein
VVVREGNFLQEVIFKNNVVENNVVVKFQKTLSARSYAVKFKNYNYCFVQILDTGKNIAWWKSVSLK